MSTNKRKNILMIALIFCCCLVTAGYFSLVNKTIVEGNIRFTQGNWNIRFRNIETVKEVGNAYNYRTPILTDYVISFYADFKEVGDSIIYEIEISNDGNLDARLSNIIFDNGSLDAIKFEYSDIRIGDILKVGEKKKMTLKVTYDKFNENYDQKTDKMQLLLNWEQAE